MCDAVYNVRSVLQLQLPLPTKKLKWPMPRPASEQIPSILGRQILLKHATSAAADVLA